MLSSLVTAFRQHYPQGSLVSELISLQDGLYIVRVSVTVEDVILSTALAAHRTLETADDLALERALGRLTIPGQGADWLPAIGGANPSSRPEIIPPIEPPAAAMSPPAPIAATKTRALAVSPPSPPKLVALQANGFSAAESSADRVSANGELTDGVVTDGVVTDGAAIAAEVLPLLADLVPATPERVSSEDLLPAAVPEASLGPPPLDFPLDLPIAPEFTAALTAPPEPPPLDHDLFNLEGIPTPSIDLSDIIAQTDVELQRLGWDVKQGREFLEKTYGKRSRHDLTDEELLEFLLFLETQPTLGQ